MPQYPDKAIRLIGYSQEKEIKRMCKKRKREDLLSKGLPFLAPREGLEPTTLRLTVACSTIELPRNLGTALFTADWRSI